MMLIDLEPDNEKIYFNLGMLSMDDKKFEQAKAWFDKAIKVLSLVCASLNLISFCITYWFIPADS